MHTIGREGDINWLDIVIIVTWAIGFLVGWRMGLFGAIFTTGGLIVGVLLAGRFSDNISELLTDSVSSDTTATVISYAIIIIIVFIAVQFLKKIVKGIFKLVFLGWVNSLGGLALGLVMGVILSGTVITGLARYSSDLPIDLHRDGIEGIIINKALDIAREGVQEKVNKALVESTFVPIFLDIQDAIPADALGFVPDDFKDALDVLKAQVDEAEE